MRRLLGATGAILALAATPALAQFDGGPGSRPHQGQERATRFALRNSPGPLPVTIIQKNTAQSIANNSWTTVTWDTAALEDDVGAFNGASPTVITVPPGYTRARITVHTVWQNIGTFTGFAQIGGTRGIGPGGQANYGLNIQTGANEHGGYVSSNWLSGLQAGDQIWLAVLQNNGGSINFSPASGFTQAWMQVEWAP